MRKWILLFVCNCFFIACAPSLHAQTCSVPSQLAANLNAASQDDVISLSGINPLNCPEVTMSQSWEGGKLIFSDSPETPIIRGKLYEDPSLDSTGTEYNRIFIYHVNGYSGSTKMKFVVILKNTSSFQGTLIVQKSGTAGPSTNFIYAGKLAFQRYLLSSAGSPSIVAAGTFVRLTTAIEALASPGYLMHGIYDYSFDQSHKIMICALNQNDDPISVCSNLSVLSRDTHQRGTFPYSDKVYDTGASIQYDTAVEIAQFPLGGGTANDAFASGIDKTDNSVQVLIGNYGILYKMHLNTKSTDGKNLGILINPRGGNWAGAQWFVSGISAGGKILIPEGTSYLGDNTKGAVTGKWSPGNSFTIWGQFMPTGGSAMPLRLVFVPY